MINEPTLESIEDYNNNESQDKRKTVRLIVLGLIILGVIYTAIRFEFNDVSDYIGTSKYPGINTTKCGS